MIMSVAPLIPVTKIRDKPDARGGLGQAGVRHGKGHGAMLAPSVTAA